MKYVILNDGETYTTLESCVIYDDSDGKIYTINQGKQIGSRNTTTEWDKGISEIHRCNGDDEEYDDMYGDDFDEADDDNVPGM